VTDIAMHIPHLHDWPTTEPEAVALQESLAGRVDVSRGLASFDLVAGCDVAYHLTEPTLFAAVAVVRVSDRAVIETHTVTCGVNFPYIPGLLSFRELPALLTAFAELRNPPDVVMLDGQGIAHPRRFDVACHLGLWLDLPCLGCAKSWLIGKHTEPGMEAGGETALTVGDETVGVVMRSATGAKPVYVSPGHCIDIGSSAMVVRATLSGYRHPTPTREAHMAANALRREFRVSS
jgi:deoxyribonuclease V